MIRVIFLATRLLALTNSDIREWDEYKSLGNHPRFCGERCREKHRTNHPDDFEDEYVDEEE